MRKLVTQISRNHSILSLKSITLILIKTTSNQPSMKKNLRKFPMLMRFYPIRSFVILTMNIAVAHAVPVLIKIESILIAMMPKGTGSLVLSLRSKVRSKKTILRLKRKLGTTSKNSNGKASIMKMQELNTKSSTMNGKRQDKTKIPPTKISIKTSRKIDSKIFILRDVSKEQSGIRDNNSNKAIIKVHKTELKL